MQNSTTHHDATRHKGNEPNRKSFNKTMSRVFQFSPLDNESLQVECRYAERRGAHGRTRYQFLLEREQVCLQPSSMNIYDFFPQTCGQMLKTFFFFLNVMFRINKL
jgi:hypothetical protein